MYGALVWARGCSAALVGGFRPGQIRHVDPATMGLPAVPSGQVYFCCEKVLRAGRTQPNMFMTVGQMGVQIFEGREHYKTYQFGQVRR